MASAILRLTQETFKLIGSKIPHLMYSAKNNFYRDDQNRHRRKPVAEQHVAV